MDKQTRYETTEKGKEARARSRAKQQEKRKELAKVRRGHEARRRSLGSAKFSKQYTVHTISVKGKRGLQLSVKKRYGATESETPQCVQGGIPRWSESISNPAYVKKLNEQETLILRLRKLLARLHKLLERKSRRKRKKLDQDKS